MSATTKTKAGARSRTGSRAPRAPSTQTVGAIDIGARLDPGICSVVSPEDREIMRQRELDELRLLLHACATWERGLDEGGSSSVVHNAELIACIHRARSCR